MTDATAQAARLMKVMEVMIRELQRQGVAEALADLNFNPRALAEVVIKAADGDVVAFPGARRDMWHERDRASRHVLQPVDCLTLSIELSSNRERQGHFLIPPSYYSHARSADTITKRGSERLGRIAKQAQRSA
jgi:hypothetical protein